MCCVAITFKMTEQVEQQICTEFCIKLERSSAETIQMTQKAFRDDVMNAAQIKVWTNASKVVENLLKVIHVLEDLQQVQHLRMLNTYRLQSTKTGEMCEVPRCLL